MARPRKPTAIKALQGTLQPCRTPKDEPVCDVLINSVAPPAHLNAKAKAAWKFAVSQMPPGVVTALDWVVFERWCSTYSKLVDIDKEVKSLGLTMLNPDTGLPFVNPLVKTQIALEQLCVRLCTELGFTPASRSKVHVKKKENEKANGFIDL